MATLSTLEKQWLKTLAKPAKAKIYTAWLLSVMATFVFVAQAWCVATFFAHWLDAFFHHTSVNSAAMIPVLLGLLACLLLRPVLNFFKDRLAVNAGLWIAQQVRQQLLGTLARIGAARYQFGSDGNLTSQIINQTDALIGYISRFELQRLISVTTPLILVIAAASQSIVAAGVMLLTAPLVPVFMILIGSATAKKSAAQFDALAQLSGRFLDWVRGIATLQRLNAISIASSDIDRSANAYRLRTMDVLKIAFLNTAALELLAALSIALLAVYLGFGLIGILPWQKNVVPVPYQSALFLLLLAPEFYAPLSQLGADYHVRSQAEGAAKSLLPIINAGSTTGQDSGRCLSLTAAPAIKFQHVTVIGEAERIRLPSLSLSIAAGESVAIIGASGSGKSTLLQVLLGFCDYIGQIMINDDDFATVNKADFRTKVAYLSQQTTLLPMSIAENLRLAQADASNVAIIEALKTVQLYDLIKQLPQGIDTVLGERGSGLSGGQQRRLAIAQLLLQQADLWLLDEPTEHLDPDTALAINQLLKTVTQGKTVLWVTHDAEALPWLDQYINITAPTVQHKTESADIDIATIPAVMINRGVNDAP